MHYKMNAEIIRFMQEDYGPDLKNALNKLINRKTNAKNGGNNLYVQSTEPTGDDLVEGDILFVTS